MKESSKNLILKLLTDNLNANRHLCLFVETDEEEEKLNDEAEVIREAIEDVEIL